MKRLKKAAALALTLILCTGLFYGCSSSSQDSANNSSDTDYHNYTMPEEEVSLNITTDLGSSNGLAMLAEAFMEVYPNVTINIESLGWENLAERVANPESEPIDGFMVKFLGEVWREDFYPVWQEYCFNFKDADDVVDLSSLNASAVDALTVEEDAVYGVPFTIYTSGMITNMDLLEKCNITKVPETTEELLADCEMIKNAGYQPFRCLSSSLTQIIMSVTNNDLVKNGKTEELIDTALHSDDAAIGDYFMPALELIETMFQKGYIDTESLVYNPEANEESGGEVPMTTYQEECYAFLNGDVAFYPVYSDVITSLQKRETRLESYNENPFHYELAVIPGIEEPALIESSSSSIFLCKDSENLEWMKQFVRFALYRESEEEIGNISIFSDNQYLMSPYDNSTLHSDISEQYYGATLALMDTVEPAPAEFKELLEYQGYGLYQSVLIPKIASEFDSTMTATAARDEINRVSKIWYADGNTDYWEE
ncbi:MAG: extracellular solute-binding protein [Lachnospiraceae bacterium]|nr:extracellular solute-binding protein [Lachnospiraceae bacterium]